jgi:uncharacterized protein
VLTVARFDAAPLGRAQRTPQGFLRAPARLTRTGVLVYRRADGTICRELRRPEQVFAEASLATLHDAPVTDLHPKEMVTPANARALTLGHVSQAPRRDGRFVAGEIVVTDGAMIEAIESGKRREVSLGYKCTLVVGAGVYEGEHFDAEQTEIVYNHVGLGPPHWARAGSEVALRLDGARDDRTLAGDDAWRQDLDDDDAGDKQRQKGNPMDLVTIRLDGIDTQVPPAAQQLITRALEQRDAAVAAAKAEADKSKARLDALQGELDGTKAKLEKATDPKRFDAEVTDRIALLERARTVLGAETKLDGKTAREIKELVVKHLDANADFAGKSDEYVQGRFDAADFGAAGADPDNDKGGDQLDRARRASARRGRTDGDEGPKYAPPPWRQPLASSRKD